MGQAAGDLAVDGRCDARFRHVGEALAENFAQHGEVGAAVAVTIDGKPVVDLWAGHADAARMRPWTRDTIVNIASATKGLTATCAHRLADRGLLDLDSPVTAYWRPSPGTGFGSSTAAAFGCPGAGGSIGFADPGAHIGFAYTMNQMQAGMPLDPRALRLIDALYASL
jgi:CubicO group peptidase (beta-lactamase class C family)